MRAECWPDIRDHHELHDLLMSLVALPVSRVHDDRARHWPHFFERLELDGRALTVACGDESCWIATERLPMVQAVWQQAPASSAVRDEALRKCVLGWIQILGPVTASQFARDLSLDAALVFQQFIALEVQGLLMRGVFELPRPADDVEIEWCERRILQRIHKLTIGTRRRQVSRFLPPLSCGGCSAGSTWPRKRNSPARTGCSKSRPARRL